MPLPREVKRSEITQQFRFYILPDILPEGHVLVLNTRPYSLSTFVLTQLSGEVHRLVAQEVLTELEMYVLIAFWIPIPIIAPMRCCELPLPMKWSVMRA